MKKSLRAILAGVLAMAICTTGAVAYDYPETAAPGTVIAFTQGDFWDKKGSGDVIPSEIKLTSSNFSIYKKTIKTGAKYIDDIKINSRAEEVQIVLSDEAIGAAPARPNIVISELSVRATKSYRDSLGDYIMKSGTIYTFGDVISIRAGLETVEMEIDRSGVDISLESGESQYVSWIRGDGDGPVYVSYGHMATGECRVYNGDKVLYYFSDEIPAALEDANPDAYMDSINLGSGEFKAALKLQILANRNDHIYEYNNGKITAAKGLKWSSDEEAWTVTLTKGRHFIVSDIKLRGVTGTTGGSGNSYDDGDDLYDDETSSTPTYDNPYNNPETGGGSNLAVSISAIVAIVAIAVLSIIMSTILAVKKKQ